MAAPNEDKAQVLLDDLFKFVRRVSSYGENRNAAEIAVLPAIAELLLKYNWLRLQLEAQAQSKWGQKVVHNAEPSIKAKAKNSNHREILSFELASTQ